MPLYVYECLPCGHQFTMRKAMHDNNVECVACEAQGYETMKDPETGQMVQKVRRIYHRVTVISDLDSSEGRIGEAVDFSAALGPDARNITSRRELREAKKRTRERVFTNTEGPKTVMKEFVDAGSGKVYREQVTNNVNGFDMGEIHRCEESEPGTNEIQSAFNPGETIAKTEADITKRLSS